MELADRADHLLNRQQFLNTEDDVAVAPGIAEPIADTVFIGGFGRIAPQRNDHGRTAATQIRRQLFDNAPDDGFPTIAAIAEHHGVFGRRYPGRMNRYDVELPARDRSVEVTLRALNVRSVQMRIELSEI